MPAKTPAPARRPRRSTRVVARPRPRCDRKPPAPVCGYGACSVSGCPCPAFKDTYGSQLCNNCGHQYTDHW